MSSISATLRDAPNKMSAEGIATVEQKFSNILAKQFHSADQMTRAHKAYQAAIEGDVSLSTTAQQLAKSFADAYAKATQIALGGYHSKEDTRFDVRLT
ncbi:hypothetical protein G7047_14690 [Diaphorobacter sp. HDW4A]|uniref:hypothetical protein n=1 Tax=Diaphorobacter sp. HDW4A TaxID=2714924 RepID=UPI00140A7D93|nr:hypothetical protein [Diaphorobacter sp. HDW4A]QIL81003.1 hypothetical protein G7047_14690 [Diaphorobacter sp. HDW4A]